MSTLPTIEKDFSGYYINKMSMYIDNAKLYIQIAMASLVLPITFYKQLLGKSDDEPFELDCFLVTSWAALLLSIGFGLFYQYFAIKRVETRIENLTARYFDSKPGIIYFLMALCFYIGILFFVISAYSRFSI
jgi:hypothetical protein